MRLLFIFLSFLFLAIPCNHAMEFKNEDVSLKNGSPGFTIDFKKDNVSAELEKIEPVNPITKYDRDIEFNEIDRDFFDSTPPSCCRMILRGMRISTSLALGFLVSMPFTSQVMIRVGDWVGASFDTTSASLLAAYIAINTTFVFANVWDKWIMAGADYLYPTYVTCTLGDDDTKKGETTLNNLYKNSNPQKLKDVLARRYSIKAAQAGKYPTTAQQKDKGYYLPRLLLIISSGAYALPWLWQILWSDEEKNFPTLGYFTLPIYYFTLGHVFYNVAERKLTTIPTSADAANKKDVLIASVMKFQTIIWEDLELRHKVYQALKKGLQPKSRTILNNTSSMESLPLVGETSIVETDFNKINDHENDGDTFLFSWLFAVHKDADLWNSTPRRNRVNQSYTEEIKNPTLIYRKHQAKAVVNGFLGIGWLTSSSLLQNTFESTFVKFKLLSIGPAYWTAIPIALIQSASFVKATGSIFHNHTQELVDDLLVDKTKPTPVLDELDSDNQDSPCCSCFGNFGEKITGALKWVGGKIPKGSNLATGVFLSLSELKRGLEIYTTYSIPEKIIGAGIPFTIGTFFFNNVFEENTKGLYRRFVTNLPSRCVSLFDCCRKANELETLNGYADEAIGLLKELNEETSEMLFNRILERQ